MGYPPNQVETFNVDVPVDVSNNTSLDLTWIAPTPIENQYDAATGYYIYRNGSLIATLGDVQSYSDYGLTANTSYSYYVIGFNSDGNGSQSSTVSKYTRPEAPTLLLYDNTTTSFNITVNPPITSYNQINWYLNNTYVGQTAGTSYEFTGLVPNNSYEIDVACANADSNEGSRLELTKITKPEPPTNISTNTRTNDSVIITFTPPSNGASSYQIINNANNSLLGTIYASGETLSGLGTNSYDASVVSINGDNQGSIPASFNIDEYNPPSENYIQCIVYNHKLQGIF